MIAELDDERARELLPELSTAQLTEFLRELPHDEAADLAADLPLERRGEALAGMPVDDSAKVTALLRYPPDSAGGIMSDRFIVLRSDQTVQQAQETLRLRAEQESGVLRRQLDAVTVRLQETEAKLALSEKRRRQRARAARNAEARLAELGEGSHDAAPE